MRRNPGQASPPSQTVVRAWARLIKAQRATLRTIEAELKTKGVPPLAWYDVLLELERAGEAGLRPFELQRALLLEQYNLSRLVDRITQAGYVERRDCADDGRGQQVAITHSGRRLRRRMWKVYGGAIERAIGANLSAGEVSELDRLLGELIERTRTGRGNAAARIGV
jgi:DNA-binding MarR family transcriptional regulator